MASRKQLVFRNRMVYKSQSDTQFTIVPNITEKVLEYCKEPKTAKEIRDYLNKSSKRYVAYNIIKPLIDMRKLEYTNKKSINARNQKYKTVD